MLYREMFKDFPNQFFEQGMKTLLCLLITALMGAILAGILQTLHDLQEVFRLVVQGGSLHEGFRHILVDALTVLAMVEVFRTATAYFVEGRVKVTYILDTVLVAVLTEVLAFWYREMETSRLLMVIALVLALMLVRILAIHFSPNRVETADGL